MNVDLSRALAPLYAAVEDAQHHLDNANADPGTHPLDVLPAAGRLIRTQAELLHALEGLLEPVKAECGCEVQLAVQGRLNALAALRAP